MTCKKQKSTSEWQERIRKLYAKKDKWISIKVEKPPLYDYVFVLANYPGTGEPIPISIARLVDDDNGEIWDFLGNLTVGAYMDIEYGMKSEDVTHWMPLPELPERG